ncbi:MAG: hypothetical protein ACXW3C_14685, partial [Pyrinomonadaceae bacterium]
MIPNHPVQPDAAKLAQFRSAPKITLELRNVRYRKALQEVKALYCPSCGAAVTQSLSYCNRCGVKLNQSERASKSSDVKPEVLVSSMVATFILGLFGLTALMGVLKVILQLQTGQILGVATFGFLIMLLLEAV